MRKKGGLKLKRIIWVGLGLCLVVLLAFVLANGSWQSGLLSQGRQHNSTLELSQTKKKPPHPSFITKAELYKVLAEQPISEDGLAPVNQSDLEGAILAGVVPHHLVAGSLITDFMSILVPQEPELLVIVGPNHDNLGGRIITGFADWQTPEGLVETEGKIVQTLLEKKIAVQDEQVLSKEHSMGSLMPLIKHFLPQVQVVPLIFHHDVTLEEVDKLLTVLDPYLPEGKGVLLASVDFSHYLTRQEAEEKDSLTVKVMTNFDYPTLFRLGNEHLDSPASLAMAFRFGEGKGLREFRVLNNTNSGVILQNDLIETTSYFTLVFQN